MIQHIGCISTLPGANEHRRNVDEIKMYARRVINCEYRSERKSKKNCIFGVSRSLQLSLPNKLLDSRIQLSIGLLPFQWPPPPASPLRSAMGKVVKTSAEKHEIKRKIDRKDHR